MKSSEGLALLRAEYFRFKEAVEKLTGAQGVIHYGLQFCQPYIAESLPVEKALKKRASRLCASIRTTAWRMWAN